MVEFYFDANGVPPAEVPHDPFEYDGTVTVTFGTSHTNLAWNDRRTMTIGQLSDLMARWSRGPKDGPCIVPATFRGTRRVMNEADVIGLAALDSDCGHTAGEIEAAIRAKGWEAIVHSTFSHLNRYTRVNKGKADKWMQANGGDIAAYMKADKGYLPRIVDAARIVDEEGANYVVEHAPCERYRILLPLQRAWVASEYPDQQTANAVWGERIKALAAALGLFTDQSCIDTSRLFYLPRGNSDEARATFYHDHIAGAPCDLWSLPEAPAPGSDADLFNRPDAPARPRLRAVEQGDTTFTGPHGEQINLTHWAAEYAGRFQIVSAMRANAPHVFGSRRPGVKHHLICPFDHEHTVAGDRTGTYVVNAGDIQFSGLTTVTSGFYAGCSHNACAGRDRLQLLKGMLEQGWLTVPDLTHPDNLTPDPNLAVDTSAMMDKLRAQATQPPAAPGVGGGFADAPASTGRAGPNGAIPAHLLQNLPPVMQASMDYLTSNTVKPQPALALAATLVMMSAAVGRKVAIADWNTRPNIYCLNVAHSGAGKDDPRNGIKQMLKAAGLLDKLVGAEDLASDVGLLAEAKQPGKQSHAMLFDEMGMLLSTVNSKNAGGHVQAAKAMLLKLFSASKGTFKSKSYADADKNFVLDQPNISLLGSTTPGTLWDNLSTEDVTSGLLSRTMLFDALDYDPVPSPPRTMPVPAAVTDWLQAWWQVSAHANPVAMDGGTPAVQPRPVSMTPGAQAMMEAYSRQSHSDKVAARSSGLDSVYVRAFENAMKLALIRATADGPDNCLITEATARWAIELARAVTNHLAEQVGKHVHDSLFQKQVATFRDAIQDAGLRGLTEREMHRRKRLKLKKQDFEAVMNHLKAAGEVEFLNVNAGKTKSNGVPVRARAAWVYVGGMKAEEDED